MSGSLDALSIYNAIQLKHLKAHVNLGYCGPFQTKKTMFGIISLSVLGTFSLDQARIVPHILNQRQSYKIKTR